MGQIHRQLIGAERVEFGYGFSPPTIKRGGYKNPENGLDEFFRWWIDLVDVSEIMRKSIMGMYDSMKAELLDSFYQDILDKIKDVADPKSLTPEEANSIVVPYKNHPRIRNAGLFLSACYNMMDAEEIVFDIDEPEGGLIEHLGYKLPETKRLVIKTDLGKNTGLRALGCIVNHASIKGELSTSGEVVNFGKVGESISGKRVINYGSSRKIHSNSSLVNFGEVGEHMNCREGPFCVNMKKASEVYGGLKIIPINFGVGNLNGLHGGLGINWGKGKIKLPEADEWFEFVGVMIRPDHRGPLGTFNYYREEELRQNTRFIKYIEALKAGIEKYRTAGYPECMGVFDFLNKHIVSEEEFAKKLNGIL